MKRLRQLTGPLIVLAAFLPLVLNLSSVSAVAPAYVQGASATPQTKVSSTGAKFAKAQVAGDTNVIAVGWNDATSTIKSLTDTKGNTYVLAVPMARGTGVSQAIYYAKNIVAATAGSNTVTVTFNSTATYIDLRISEYGGLDSTNPFDKGASGSGTAFNASTPSVATTSNNELVFGAGVTTIGFYDPGAGFTMRISTPDADMTFDKTVSTIGSYNASATILGNWVLQVATFRAAGSTSDITAPSVPTGLMATLANKTQINLAWTASTDNVGVTGYKVFRGGTQIATVAGNSYSNTGLTQGVTYDYTVAAYDAAGNTSAQSAIASASTPPPDTAAPSVPDNLVVTPVSVSQVDLAWAASTDDTSVTGYKVFRDGVQIANVAGTSYSNTGLTANTAYSYSVAAYDAAGNTSAQSLAVATATLADTTAPNAPASLTATSNSTSQVNLSWQAPTDNVGVTGYNLYRDGVKVASLTGTSYSDTGLSSGTAYAYNVSAVDAASNESAQSLVANVTTMTPDLTPPSVPAGLAASSATTSSINLTWTASTDNFAVTGYKVYRGATQVGSVSQTSFNDTGLTAATNYSYTVVAYDTAGNTSLPSQALNTSTTNPTAQGMIVSTTTRSLNATLSNVATAKKITYYSTDPSGTPIVVSGVVLQPKNAPASGGKVIAWAHGTTGIADSCAPSTTNNMWWDGYADEVASYLAKGWTVAATDYAGLGTAGVHPYGVGESEGRAVIDSVRAARNMYPTLSTDWIVSGHSQGGQASLFTGQIADTYGTGLNLKGVVALAAATATPDSVRQIVGTPYQGYLAFGIYGLSAVDPSVVPSQILGATALTKQNLILNTGCWDAVMSSFSTLTATQMLKNGVLPQSIVDKEMQQNPGQEQSSAPVRLSYGDSDELMPPIIAQTLQGLECAQHSISTLTLYPGVDHSAALAASNADNLQFMMDRFAGLPAPNQCQ